MSSSPNSRSSSPAPSLVSFLSSSVVRTLQRISSEVTGEDDYNRHNPGSRNPRSQAATNPNGTSKKQNKFTPTSSYAPSTASSYSAAAPIRRPSPYAPPPLTPLKFAGIPTSTSSSSIILTKTIAEEIRQLIPARLQLHETWTLMYSLELHGVSLSTLYSRLGKGSFVFVVKDTGDGSMFGAFANEALHPAPGRYYGTGECFLWKATTVTPLLDVVDTPEKQQQLDVRAATSSPLSQTGNIRFKAFPYSGVNDYMILCDHNFISFGGGDGHYGLWVDDNFNTGVSSTCPTFGNEPLSDEGEKFEILGIEVWRVGNAPH